jgi:tetratricopeptide (TPR) repeat protein
LYPARLVLARLRLRQGDERAAITQLQQLLSLNPAHREARQRLVTLYRGRGDVEQARELLEEARQSFPRQPVWAEGLARLAERQGNLEAAEQHWRQAVQVGPSLANLRGLCQLLLKRGQPAEVETVLTSRSQVLNRVVTLQGLRARALAEAGKKDQARNVFRQALQRAQQPTAAVQLGRQLRAALGEKSALNELTSVKAKLQQPALAELAAAQVFMEGQQFEAALERLQPIEGQIQNQAGPLAIMFNRLRGTCFQKLGRYEKAQAAYQQVLDELPNDVNVLNNLAYLLARHLDQPQRAIELAHRAADQNPRNVQVLDTLGWAYYQAGNLPQARATLQRSVALQPLSHNQLHLGRVLMELGLTDQARARLQAAQKMAKQNELSAVSDQASRWLEALTES